MERLTGCRLRWWRAFLPVALACAVSSVQGGEQADQALAAVARLMASGEIAPGATLKLAFKPGNINALLGPNLEFQREWEERTGTLISARVMPNQPTLANFENFPAFDLTVGRPHEHRELLDRKLIAPLDDLAARFNFKLAGDAKTGFIRPRLQAYQDGRLVAVPADGDVTLLYLRRDLLEDPAEQKAYRAKTGRKLAVPTTWDEFDAQVRFFHRPGKGLYGAAEERDPEGGWMFWIQRYLSQSAPIQSLFDEKAHPLIDSPAGVNATSHYVNSARFGPPGATERGNDYSFTLPLFTQGKAYALINTIAGAKIFNAQGSAVRGKFLVVPLPGKRIAGKLLRRNMPIYGNNLVVAESSPNKALAFLFAMWLTDPDNSLRTVGVRGGHTDPYRWHHLQDQRIDALYTGDALRTFAAEWAVAVPSGTGLIEESAYLAILDDRLWQAAKGELSPAEAMRQVAAGWEALTERVGRDRQAMALKAFRSELLRAEPLPSARRN